MKALRVIPRGEQAAAFLKPIDCRDWALGRNGVDCGLFWARAWRICRLLGSGPWDLSAFEVGLTLSGDRTIALGVLAITIATKLCSVQSRREMGF
ncbi:hypothetical protein WH91_16155 [Devosia psychrophila]|uniref:Uncharacterized protein n=1 Tax=Devosia psychrophila TaxID=728005 RepID=A0ABR5DVI7_9HYPH|nr:hypothetical protein WH91_16155 [Devosia psychrophila]